MMKARRLGILLAPLAMATAWGCAAPNVDFSTMKQPARAAELDAYNLFVGDWDWKAEVVNTEGASKQWSGSATWAWTLDSRCLHGVMSSKSAEAAFNAAGVWSWHPAKKQYIWWMFNNWGYPQEGTATYDKSAKKWTMDYTSVGLDGTASTGCYTMQVTDKNTLDWRMTEWTDALHTVMKLDMKGKYIRKK